MSKAKMSQIEERQYAVNLLNKLADAATDKISPEPVHTNEVFSLLKKFKIAPTPAKSFHAKVRAAAKARRPIYVEAMLRPAGDTHGFEQAVGALREARQDEADAKRSLIYNKADELGEKLMIDNSLTPKQAILKFREFVRANS